MRETKLHAYKPERDIFRYTVFHKHVPDLLNEWQTDYAQIDLAQTYFIADGEPPIDTLVEILVGNQRCYLISGHPDEDKKASLLKAAYDCVKSPHLPPSLCSYVPCRVDCHWRTTRIHGHIAQTLGRQEDDVKDIIFYSPPIFFFFDLNQVAEEYKNEFVQALDYFIKTCLAERFPEHKFVLSDKDFKTSEFSFPTKEYEFQPRLDVILERDSTRLPKALENIKYTERGRKNIRQFLFPLKPKSLSRKQQYDLILGLRILVNSPDDQVRNRTRALLTEIIRDGTFEGTKRRRAVEAICEVQSGETTAVTETLLYCLADKNADIRRWAAKGLGKLGKRKLLGEYAEETLKTLLKAEQKDYAVIESLGQVSRLSSSMSMRNSVLKTLISHWGFGDSDVDPAVVSAIGELGMATRETVEILETALRKGKEKSINLIGEVALLLDKAKGAFDKLRAADEGGIAALVKASQSEDGDVQEYARRALCHIRDDKSQ